MAELDAGTVVDGYYEILAAVGTGGLGTVYRARDVKDDSTVALKMLNIVGEEAQRRFLREFNILSRIRHPRIVRSHRWGLYAGKPYFSMDYISGRPLSDLVASAGDLERLRTAWLLPLIRQIGEGLAYIHNHGLVHRDLKPSNVMISEDSGEPNVIILDLGLARFQDSRELRLTQPGSTTGTVEYMSPEQIRGRAMDQRSDLYSLGVILYEILTGSAAVYGWERGFGDVPAFERPATAPSCAISPAVFLRISRCRYEACWKRSRLTVTIQCGRLLQDMPEGGDGNIDWETGPGLTTSPSGSHF